MGTSYIQQPWTPAIMWKASFQLVSKNSEITLPQRPQALFAKDLVQYFAIALDIDVDLQRASLVRAASALAVPTLKALSQWLLAGRTVIYFHALVSLS